jgi:hypothetical protein
MRNQNDGLDLLWEVAEIAAFIGREPRQTYHMLSQNQLPARRIAGRWVASKAVLREFFSMPTLDEGEVEAQAEAPAAKPSRPRLKKAG